MRILLRRQSGQQFYHETLDFSRCYLKRFRGKTQRAIVGRLPLTILLLLFWCAAQPRLYLTPAAQQIKQQVWNSQSLVHDYFMKGTKYQTPILRFAGPNPGPAVLILAGTHGNEPAGFEAAYRLIQQLANMELKAGEIFIVPEVNRLADSLNERRVSVPKGIPIEKGNLNRCYPGHPDGLPMERLAYQITQFIEAHHIGLLLDLHESPKFHLEYRDDKGNYHGLGQTLIYTPNEAATYLAMITADEMNETITDQLKRFSLVEQPIAGSAAWCAGTQFGIPAFTVETCKQLSLEERVDYQLRIVKIMLRESGIIE